MTERVHTPVNKLQDAAPDPAVDGTPVNAGSQELSSRHDPELPRGHGCNQCVRVTFASHREANVTGIGHGASLPYESLRLTREVRKLR
jgi:hypothetical protein